MTARPPHCGRPDCDPATRMVEVGDDRRPERCPCAKAATTYADLLARRDALTAQLADVEKQLAELEAPEWVRGPGTSNGGPR